MALRDTIGLGLSIAVKTLVGGLQWALIWHRPAMNDNPGIRERLAEAMVKPLQHGLAARMTLGRDI